MQAELSSHGVTKTGVAGLLIEADCGENHAERHTTGSPL
jgi:hypothetical protein